MKLVNVDISQSENKSYPIFIDECGVVNFDDVLSKISPKKILVVTNETIYGVYHEMLPQLFKRDNIGLEYCILPDGEIFKNKSSLEIILACAFDSKMERNDVFVAFGGGVIGDMTGFAASVYLRGVNFIQIPTTLLAQVDSSVGGKTGINTPYGKNLLGAFYQPKAVICDLGFLKTLPEREILTGISEVIKYSFIEKNCGLEFSDFAKFLYVNKNNIISLKKEEMGQLVETCCKLKAEVVRQDEKEKGLRTFLNFGHTVAHSVEKCTDYNVFTHGEAVAIGMRCAFLLSLRLGKINQEYFDFAIDLLKQYNLLYKIPQNITPEKIVEALSYDKKVKNGVVRFVLPVAYAKAEIVENVDSELIIETVKELY